MNPIPTVRHTAPVSPARGDRWRVAGLLLITLVGALVSSLGAPLMPAIAQSTQVSLATAQWTLTVTVLVAVAITPVMGRLGDTRHRRVAVLVALTLVAIGSVVAALGTSNFPVLLIGRALQGAGQGLAPVTIAVAGDTFSGDPARRKRVVAILSIVNAAGVGLGYPLTGVLAQGAGISGAYWFGAAVTVAALLTAPAVVPAPRDRPASAIDVPGAVLFALPVTALILATSEGGNWGWTSPATLTAGGTALLVGAAWAWFETRMPYPLVDLRQLRVRPVLSAHVTVLLAGIGMYLLLSVSTRMIQAPSTTGGLGKSAVVAGLLMLPQALGSLAAGWTTRRLGRWLPARWTLPLAGVVMMAAMALFALWRHSLPGLMAAMLVAGIGIGIIFSTAPGLIVENTGSDQRGSALGFNQVFRYVGYGFGSVLTAVVLESRTPHGSPYPDDGGYVVAALAGVIIWLLVAVVSGVTGRRRPVQASSGEKA